MSRRAWILFISVSLIWGVPYLFIKLALEDGASPMLVAWGRVTIGAALLLPIAWKLGYLDGLREKRRALIAFSIAECGLPWWLIPIGEQHVSSSLAAILIASLPIATAVVAIRIDHTERVTGIRLAGLFLGFGGVVLLLGVDVGGQVDELLGALAILGATACYAGGLFIVKHNFSDVNPIGATAVALGIASVMLAPAGIASLSEWDPGGAAVGSIAVLGAVCSALALILFFGLISEVGASKASVITYVNPAVAVTLGIVLLGESITAAVVAGMLLILAGSWIATGGGLPPGLGAIVTRQRRLRGAPTAQPRYEPAELGAARLSPGP
jgi:drug/metabolite transporter (DMT)-like permease